ncbi:MAG: hypothetical protein WCX13_04785, partial [Candidatus Hydrogenedentales bacterium]
MKGYLRPYGACEKKTSACRATAFIRPSLILFLAVFISILPAAAQTVLMPGNVAPGDPFLCWMASDRPVISASAFLKSSDGKNLSSAESFFMPSEGEGYLYGFLLAIPTKAAPGPGSLLVSAAFDGSGPGSDPRDKAEVSADFVIEPKKFMKEDIPLDKANTEIRAKPDPAKTAESKVFADIFDARDPTALFAMGPMVKPLSVPWRETAGFGDERRYIYDGGGGDSTIHGGIDLGAKTGSEVLACA